MKSSLLVVGIALGMAALAAPYSPSSVPAYWLFSLCLICMFGLVFIRPFSYAYSFLATFFFLGFWGKFIFHITFGNPLIEPTGAFDGSVAQWDAALTASATAAIGIAVARLIHLAYLLRRGCKTEENSTAPSLYIAYRKLLWSLSLAVIIGVAIWNSTAAFYQIGVNPRVALPFHLNVLLSWAINWGFVFWLACLVHWELKFSPRNARVMYLAILVEAAAMGISSLSRSAYAFHGLAGLIPWANSIRRRLVLLIFLGMVPYVLGLAVTLYVVQTQRAELYLTDPVNMVSPANGKGIVAKKSMLNPQAQRGMLMQIPYLVINRWVGLEAMLAVSAHPSKNFHLFYSALKENPQAGVDSIFQKIAGSSYEHSEKFTFLTLAGAAAIFYYSNSFALIFIGLALVTAVVLLIEITANRLTQNPYILSIAGIAMAYTVTQVTYPYLAAIFFLELIATIIAIAIVSRIKLPSNKKQNANA